MMPSVCSQFFDFHNAWVNLEMIRGNKSRVTTKYYRALCPPANSLYIYKYKYGNNNLGDYVIQNLIKQSYF